MTKALKKISLTVAKCLIKVKKKTPQIPCTINLAQRWIQKDRDPFKIDQIENVTVKKT